MAGIAKRLYVCEVPRPAALLHRNDVVELSGDRFHAGRAAVAARGLRVEDDAPHVCPAGLVVDARSWLLRAGVCAAPPSSCYEGAAAWLRAGRREQAGHSGFGLWRAAHHLDHLEDASHGRNGEAHASHYRDIAPKLCDVPAILLDGGGELLDAHLYSASSLGLGRQTLGVDEQHEAAAEQCRHEAEERYCCCPLHCMPSYWPLHCTRDDCCRQGVFHGGV